MEVGIVIEDSDSHEWKHELPKEKMFSWSSIEAREVQWEKHPFGSDLTDVGIITEGSNRQYSKQ